MALQLGTGFFLSKMCHDHKNVLFVRMKVKFWLEKLILHALHTLERQDVRGRAGV